MAVLHQGKIQKSFIYEALFIACLLMLIVFPDVIFKSASLRMTDQLATTYYGGKVVKPIYPTPEHTQWWSSYNDTGGAIFQSEPMVEFMKRTIQNGDSPYWNPYSGAGALGPETLVDIKFSPLTIITALLNGNSLTFNISMLLCFALGTGFMYLTMRQIFHLSPLAATGTGIFYLLNGYSIANVGSNIAQSYLFIPLCLYVVLTYSLRPNILKFILLIFTFAIILTCTFLPTTVVGIIGIYIIGLGLIVTQLKSNIITAKDGIYLILSQFVAGICAILILSLLYFPIFENIKSTGLLERYGERRYFPLGFPGALVQLFSTSLFFESYNAMDIQAKLDITLNTVYHFGITAITLAGCSFALKSSQFKPLLITCVICIVLAFGHLFGVPLLSQSITNIPIAGKIANQYWWLAVLLPFTILLGFGINNLQKRNAKISPALFLLFIGIISSFYINKSYGLHEPNLDFKILALIGSILLTLFVIITLTSIRVSKIKWFPPLGNTLIILALLLELTADAKVVRCKRKDFFKDPPPAIQMIQKDIGLFRTLNFGNTGLYPEIGSAFGIQEVSSLNEGGFSYYDDFFHSTFDLERSQQFAYNTTYKKPLFPSLLSIRDEPDKNTINWDNVNLLGIKYILMPSSFLNYRKAFIDYGMRLIYESPHTFVFENPYVLPRAFGVQLENQDGSEISLPSNFSSNLTPLDISLYRNTEVEINGIAPSNMLVVLTDNWHANWTAIVNGTPENIARVNGTFRGVFVPKGPFKIEMSYRPKTLSSAFIVTGLMLAGLLLVFVNRNKLDRLIKSKWHYWSKL